MKKEWQKFINEVIKHGDKVKAYKSAYPNAKSDNSAAVNAIRLIKNDKIASAIREGSAKAQQKGIDKAINFASNEVAITLLTAIEKRSILAKIARGDHKILETVFTREGQIDYERAPTPAEVAKAIEIDNKMTGDNEPDKVDSTINLKNFKVTDLIGFQ